MLPTGWTVTKAIKPGAEATGGAFSNAYMVENNGVEGFLKAFDFSTAFQCKNVLEALNALTTAYLYERDLLVYCKEKRLRKVVVAIEHGEVQVPDYDPMNGRVFYLIFHLADGDMRQQFEEPVVEAKSFTVTANGGSAWRWSVAFKFNYSRHDNTWQLVRVDESSFSAIASDKGKQKTSMPPKDFGKIGIAEFDPENWRGRGAK